MQTQPEFVSVNISPHNPEFNSPEEEHYWKILWKKGEMSVISRELRTSVLTHYQTTNFKTLSNWKSLQTTISNLTKMAKSYLNG